MTTRIIITWVFVITTLVAFSQNTRNVLIYNKTSTECGDCTCKDSIFTNFIVKDFPNTIIVAFHENGSPHFISDYQGNDVVNSFHQNFDPSAFIDGLGYDTYFTEIVETVSNRYDEYGDTQVSVEIDSKTWNPVSRMVDIEYTIKNDGDNMGGNYWHNIIVTEDNIIHDHATCTGCSTPNFPHLPLDTNYINNWVTRSLEYYSEGSFLVGPTWNANQSLTNSHSISIDSAWIEQNCNIVINVYEKADSLYKSPVQQAIQEPVMESSDISNEDYIKNGIIKIHPNPVDDIANIHISISCGSLCSVNMYDLNGRKVKSVLNRYMSTGLYNVEVSTVMLKAGIYLILFESDSGRYSQKIVVQ